MRTWKTGYIGAAALLMATVPVLANSDHECRIYAQRQIDIYLMNSLRPEKACGELGTVIIVGVMDASPLGCLTDGVAIYGTIVEAYWTCRAKRDGTVGVTTYDEPKFIFYRQ